MVVSGRWRLHPLHLYLIRSYLDIEDLTLPLEGSAYCRTTQQVGEIARREYPTMESLGLIANNEIDPELARALNLLAKPHLWVDSLWFPEFGGEASWRTVAVITEVNRIVLGVQPPSENERFGGWLTVEVHDDVALPAVLLPTLPPAPPGNRSALAVPASSFRRDEPDSTSESVLSPAQPVRASSGDRRLTAYEAIGTAPHVRVGQIAANLRDRNGKIHRSEILRWFDNAEPDGRYMDHNQRSNTGERVYLLTPADARLLGAHIDALIASVR